MTGATNTDLTSVLESIENLPSMPAVAVQVVKLAQDEDACIDDFAAVVALDPALAGKLLRLANSPAYNAGAEIRTVQRAVMLLGLKSVKLLALSFSLVQDLPRDGKTDFAYRDYWRRTVTCASAAHVFGSVACRPLVDEAFLCGLMSRVGQLAMGHGLWDTYCAVVDQADAWPTPQVERSVLGYDADRLAASLLRTWSVPDLICDCLELAHDPAPVDDSDRQELRDLRRLLQIATKTEELVCSGDRQGTMSELISLGDSYFGLSADEMEDCLRSIEGRVAETADMLEVKMRPVRMEEILKEAQKELLEESLAIATGMEQVTRMASQLESTNRALRDKVHRDPLTGVANRRCFDENLERCLEAHRSEDVQGGMGLLMIDIDAFKAVNDEYGHPVGDEVLKQVAETIASIIRDHDLVARYGGEEFAVIFATTTLEGMEGAAERIRKGVEAKEIEVDGKSIKVTVSVGAAHAPKFDRLLDAWSLVSAADDCLYQAKREGRNRWRSTHLTR